MKVLVLGSTGMLGHMCVSQLSNVFDVTSTSRSGNDVRFDALYDDVKALPDANYVINCIGCIKQKDYSEEEFTFVNGVFPHNLSKRFKRVIHVSTDCVFSGKRGCYNENDIVDAIDIYGVSKQLGENDHNMNIRTSVIGPELETQYGFLSWAFSNAGMPVNGYSDHMWNGLTSLQFAKTCEKIITNKLYKAGTFHVFSNSLSKHDMLVSLNATFALNLKISETRGNVPINRTLCTIDRLNDALNVPTFEQMLLDLKGVMK